MIAKSPSLAPEQLDANALIACLCDKLAAYKGIESFHFIGIERGGMLLANWLHKKLEIQGALCSLNISFHRDDFSSKGLAGQRLQKTALGPSNIPVDLEGAQVMLIDDVFMTGRSTRAALNEIFDFGRPALVRFACLIDLGVRELPIGPDIVATRCAIEPHQRIELSQDKNAMFCLQLRDLPTVVREEA